MLAQYAFAPASFVSNMFILSSSSEKIFSIGYPISKKGSTVTGVNWVRYKKYASVLIYFSLTTLIIGIAALLKNFGSAFFDLYASIVLISIIIRIGILVRVHKLNFRNVVSIENAPIFVWVDIYSFLASIILMDFLGAIESDLATRQELLVGSVVIAGLSLIPPINVAIHKISRKNGKIN